MWLYLQLSHALIKVDAMYHIGFDFNSFNMR